MSGTGGGVDNDFSSLGFSKNKDSFVFVRKKLFYVWTIVVDKALIVEALVGVLLFI